MAINHLFCPEDQTALVNTDYEGGVLVDKCPKCYGKWVEAKELQRIQTLKENDYSEELKSIPNYVQRAYIMAREKKGKQLSCPVCQSTLELREYGYSSQIIMDVCPSCQGIWLDNGELKALEIFFERARADSDLIRFDFFTDLLDIFD